MTSRAAVATVAAALALSACSRGYRSEQASGDTRARLTADVYPLVVGRNLLKIEVADARGDPLPDDARVEIRYGLPPMPGMRAIDDVAASSRNGNAYVFTADIHTRARWTVSVTVSRAGMQESQFSFAMDTQ